MKNFRLNKIFWLGVLMLVAGWAQADDPRTNSWFTTYSGKYARIYTTDVNRTNGVSATTWTNSTVQSLPAYCGVQEIYSSSNWVYLRTTGLGSHVMGAWYLDKQHTQLFPNWPINQKTLYRIPRNPAVPTAKTANGGGPIGYFVDGVAMFNSWDAYTWSTVSNVDAQNITGYWNRDAYYNEGSSFDANFSHQANGQYHYHANVPALRYLLGDHIDFNSVTKIYTEQTSASTKHSPILAWTADGFPLYGPYGYATATNAGSGIKRMISGYVLRNGLNGTDNLTNTLRTNLPAWSVRLFGTNYGNNFTGQAVSTNLGKYMEDNAYLGDLTNSVTHTNYQQGTDFDLDEYNGRYCVTPEFPGGTYAYFISISTNGTPVFPYNIGRGFYGSPVGGSVSSITETVTTNFLGGTNIAGKINSPAITNGTVTLTWSAVEGGSYQVESTTNFNTWTTNAASLSPTLTTGTYSHVPAASQNFYRTRRTAVATFDSAGTTTFSSGNGYGISSVSPASTNANHTFTLTINLDSSVNLPPQTAPINSVTLGSYIGTSNTHVSTTQVTSSITIPNGAATGVQTVTVVFPGPPTNPTAVVTYALTNGFTIY